DAKNVLLPLWSAVSHYAVPLSLGPSSVTLLYLLDKRLHERANKFIENGYAIHVLYIDLSTAEPGSPAPSGLLDSVKQRFPEHTYWVVPLEDIFDHDDVRPCEGHQEYESILSSQIRENLAGTNREKLERCLSSISSATSRSDAVQILRNQLIVQFAKSHDHKTILWGDTTTRLAEKTLSETAKGRGFSIPWHLSEGPSPFGVSFHHPLRDLLRKEVMAFAALVPLSSLIAAGRAPTESIPASARSATIDDLMAQYFGPVEENYPNIVANVVNTATKLKISATATDAQDIN
ncbi:MAG: cytoplasmic tRNA 2-thiolation protein 2, partial [Peltula sp. TS41687]